ncbi:imidazole glycerol phosphate synthase subunit hisH protein family [Synechococcus sp. BIOS-U3-1]|uniref:imidazole glycerol phosphate synthase subunit HisH n=1 Tax=Synechococcus sp. BIOS-U3-1 TaxID=1400865 RepID=UPI0016440D8A|nr:imidazole glycerol phosphate synthase subunit HisH [Synechococcus sp. BIOS-U3-1]QNI57185.1 imidazole glycerol phosphate synthase subunit hisH protein family [Synechococcus sp. BIOS-U3-1]
MITIVDYGLGNVKAIANIYNRLGIACSIARDPDELIRSKRLILPGVGAFDWAIKRLEASRLRPVLDELVINRRVPVLGICVGMQIMANRSEEGLLPGLGWIPGDVKRFDENLLSSKICLPHIGWNNVIANDHSLFGNILDPRFYFLHSYYFLPCSVDLILAKTHYGLPFASAVCLDHVIGVQFHPEKSHRWGTQLLQNFAQFEV